MGKRSQTPPDHAPTRPQVKETATQLKEAGGEMGPEFFVEVEELMDSIKDKWGQLSDSACNALQELFQEVGPVALQTSECTDRMGSILRSVEESKVALEHLFQAQLNNVPAAVPIMAEGAVRLNSWSRDELQDTADKLTVVAEGWVGVAQHLDLCRKILEKEEQIMVDSEAKFKCIQEWTKYAAMTATGFTMFLVHNMPSDSDEMQTLKIAASSVVAAVSGWAL